MSTPLQGKVIAVTGAAGGIGTAVTERLRRDGAIVYALDLRRPDGPTGIAVDVTDPESVESAFSAILRQEGRLDGAVAGAGIVEDDVAAETMSSQQFSKIIGVNLLGVFHTLTAAGRHLLVTGFRQLHRDQLDERQPHGEHPATAVRLQRLQSGGVGPGPILGRRVGRSRCSGQLCRPWLHCDGAARGEDPPVQPVARPHSAGTDGHFPPCRRDHSVLAQRRCRLLLRQRTSDGRRLHTGLVVTAPRIGLPAAAASLSVCNSRINSDPRRLPTSPSGSPAATVSSVCSPATSTTSLPVWKTRERTHRRRWTLRLIDFFR